MPSLESPFLFTTCQAGMEPALKKEVARLNPELKLAFSRPGFVTFKSPVPIGPDFELPSIFARTYGVSLGKTRDFPALPELARGSGAKHVHVHERDFHPPGEAPKGHEPGKLAEAVQALFPEPALPSKGDLVFDVVLVEANEAWYGLHRHSALHSPFPGARPRIEVPAEAPSRAFLKLEEAIAYFNVPLREGDTAVEIGSAPGGASYALLRRGLHVVGIDPGQMAPVVLKSARYSHLPQSVVGVKREELPESVQWLLLDINVYPEKALASVHRLGTRMMDSLLGVVLTLKLNDELTLNAVPSLIEQVREIGMARVRATQLASAGREICVFGLTRKGLSRTH